MSHALAFHEGFAGVVAGVGVEDGGDGASCWSIGTETDSELDLEEGANEEVAVAAALGCSLLSPVAFSWGYDSFSDEVVTAVAELKVCCCCRGEGEPMVAVETESEGEWED